MIKYLCVLYLLLQLGTERFYFFIFFLAEPLQFSELTVSRAGTL